MSTPKSRQGKDPIQRIRVAELAQKVRALSTIQSDEVDRLVAQRVGILSDVLSDRPRWLERMRDGQEPKKFSHVMTMDRYVEGLGRMPFFAEAASAYSTVGWNYLVHGELEEGDLAATIDAALSRIGLARLSKRVTRAVVNFEVVGNVLPGKSLLEVCMDWYEYNLQYVLKADAHWVDRLYVLALMYHEALLSDEAEHKSVLASIHWTVKRFVRIVDRCVRQLYSPRIRAGFSEALRCRVLGRDVPWIRNRQPVPFVGDNSYVSGVVMTAEERDIRIKESRICLRNRQNAYSLVSESGFAIACKKPLLRLGSY